jgi:endonuclease/exonuclease/phosphatase family metal-dependent hydrolase
MIAQLRKIPMHIKIITINTWKCDGEYRLRMRIMAEQLKRLKPDIIACQECFVSEDAKADTLKFLAAQLGMDYLFAAGRNKKRFFENRWVDSLSGLGVLSVYPLTGLNNFSLPATAEDNDRKAQQVEVCLPGQKKLLLTNVHLTHLRNTELRKAQAEFVADNTKFINGYLYKVVCGDFNAEPDSIEIEAFLNRCSAADCYINGGGRQPRNTLVEALNRQKHIRVDHVFVLPMFGENTFPNFVDSAIVLNEPDKATGVYPSDHFGISTTLVTD